MLANLVSTFTALNSVSSLGVIGLLSYVIYLMIAKKGPIKTISDNHLSGLPEMNATLVRMEESSKRQETTLGEIRDGINYLKGRVK